MPASARLFDWVCYCCLALNEQFPAISCKKIDRGKAYVHFVIDKHATLDFFIVLPRWNDNSWVVAGLQNISIIPSQTIFVLAT